MNELPVESSPTAAPAVRRRGERGAVLVEAALVFPIFLLLIFGIISWGFDIGLQQSMTHAAAEAARDAVGQAATSSQCAGWTTSATNTVNSSLSWVPSSASVTPVITYTDGSGATTCTAGTTMNPTGTTYMLVKINANSILPHMPGFAPSSVSSQAKVEVQ